jgi:hypothetical protein
MAGVSPRGAAARATMVVELTVAYDGTGTTAALGGGLLWMVMAMELCQG